MALVLPPSTASSSPTTPAPQQMTSDVISALRRGRHRLVLAPWTDHLDRIVAAKRESHHETASSAAAWARGLGPPPSLISSRTPRTLCDVPGHLSQVSRDIVRFCPCGW